MALLAFRSINVLLQMLVLVFLNVSLFVLAIIAIFAGDFTMFVVLLSLNYILVHTAMAGAAKHAMAFADELDLRRASKVAE